MLMFFNITAAIFILFKICESVNQLLIRLALCAKADKVKKSTRLILSRSGKAIGLSEPCHAVAKN